MRTSLNEIKRTSDYFLTYKKQIWAEVEENSKDDFTFFVTLKNKLLYISHFAQPLSVLFIFFLVSFHLSLLSLTPYSIYSFIVSLSRFVLPFSCCSFVHRGKVFVRKIPRWLFYRLSAIIAWINDRIYYLE